MSELAFIPRVSYIYQRKVSCIIPGFYKVVGVAVRQVSRSYLWDEMTAGINPHIWQSHNVYLNPPACNETVDELMGIFIELNTTKFGYPKSKLGNPGGVVTWLEDLSGRGRRFMFCNYSIALFPTDIGPRAFTQVISNRVAPYTNLGRFFHSLKIYPILKEYIDGKITVDTSTETFCVSSSEYNHYDRVIRGQISGPVAGVKGRTPEVSKGFVIDRTTGSISREQPKPEPSSEGYVRSDIQGTSGSSAAW